MSSSIVPAPSAAAPSDNYVLISSVSPTAASSTVSFTSITGYRKLMFRQVGTQLTTSGYTRVTFNSDTGNNYSYATVNGTTTIENSTVFTAANIALSTANNTPMPGLNLIIDGITSTGPKPFTGFGQISGVTCASINGIYFASAAITTITLTATTTFNGAGTVALYGVLA
jgi:hypothetical protein